MNRYERQIKMIGEEGQRDLSFAVVAIAGLGGLGTVAATYLAYAGVTNFILIDDDGVNLSNLNRQIMYHTTDVRLRKVCLARKRLEDIISKECYIDDNKNHIDKSNVDELIEGATVVLDCLDNEESRKILCRSAVKQNIPLVYGAVCGWNGIVMTVHNSACPWCIAGQDYAVEEKAILGATCGVIGSMQALEAIKVITGMGNPLFNKTLFWQGFSCLVDEIEEHKDRECSVCGSSK